MDKPIYDIVHGIIKTFEELAVNPIQPLTDEEMRGPLFHKPPHTGRKKTAL